MEVCAGVARHLVADVCEVHDPSWPLSLAKSLEQKPWVHKSFMTNRGAAEQMVVHLGLASDPVIHVLHLRFSSRAVVEVNGEFFHGRMRVLVDLGLRKPVERSSPLVGGWRGWGVLRCPLVGMRRRVRGAGRPQPCWHESLINLLWSIILRYRSKRVLLTRGPGFGANVLQACIGR